MMTTWILTPIFNPLNTKLNPICHLLALLGAHLILHVSRIRVNVLLGPKKRAVKTCLNTNSSFFLIFLLELEVLFGR